MLPQKKLQVKSYNSCIILDLEDYSYGDAIEKIDEKFSNSSMYNGFIINKIVSANLTDKEIENIITYIEKVYGIIYKEKEISVRKKTQNSYNEDKDSKIVNLNNSTKNLSDEEKYDEIDTLSISSDTPEKKERSTKIFKETLRSGREIDYDGNVVLIGDVNPGAKIKATGDIIIFGSLRGIAHAGVNGNRDCVIISHSVDAVQLIIDDIIAIPPEDINNSKSKYFIAYIDKIDDQIIIEAKN